MRTQTELNQQDLSRLTLSYFGKIGPRSFKKIQALDPDLNLNSLTAGDYTSAGIRADVAGELAQFVSQFDIEAACAQLDDLGITVISDESERYPLLLKEIHDAPYILYYLGDMGGLQRQSLAVVGSRRHTHYGKRVIEDVVPTIASNGVTIVSGLALGIDALAHQTTLASGGCTVAIVGCGLDILYPAEHQQLAKNIVASGGAILSEYAPGTPPLKQHFPARNRIIAGVAQGTLVVECDLTSGAMITAHHALEQNREVYAVPGPISSIASAGPNSLLRLGAHVITSPDDLLGLLGLQMGKKTAKLAAAAKPTHLPQQESAIFALLTSEPQHIDSITEQSKLEMAEVNSALLFLEMKGLVANVGAAQYVRR